MTDPGTMDIAFRARPTPLHQDSLMMFSILKHLSRFLQ